LESVCGAPYSPLGCSRSLRGRATPRPSATDRVLRRIATRAAAAEPSPPWRPHHPLRRRRLLPSARRAKTSPPTRQATAAGPARCGRRTSASACRRHAPRASRWIPCARLAGSSRARTGWRHRPTTTRSVAIPDKRGPTRGASALACPRDVRAARTCRVKAASRRPFRCLRPRPRHRHPRRWSRRLQRRRPMCHRLQDLQGLPWPRRPNRRHRSRCRPLRALRTRIDGTRPCSSAASS
jgi:hypothetical protein